MKVQMHVLAVGAGTLENDDGKTVPWANINVLDGELHEFDDGTRIDKGVKVAKINVNTDNNNAVSKRFFNESFPADFTLIVDTSVKKGAMSISVKDFISNIKVG